MKYLKIQTRTEKELGHLKIKGQNCKIKIIVKFKVKISNYNLNSRRKTSKENYNAKFLIAQLI